MSRGSDNPGVNAVSLRNNAAPQWLTRLADYWTLTKPEVNFLVLVSTLVGFYLASRGPLDFWRLFHTLLGTLLVASGTGTLNQYIERHSDKRMRRTANRPLPAGRLAPPEAFWFGILLAALGGWELWVFTNPLTSELAWLTLGAYLLFQLVYNLLEVGWHGLLTSFMI